MAMRCRRFAEEFARDKELTSAAGGEFLNHE
jgi:hypothetical protein